MMGQAGGAATMHAGSGVAPAPGMHIGEFGMKMDTNLLNGMDIGELREKMNRSFGDIHCSSWAPRSWSTHRLTKLHGDIVKRMVLF